MWEEVCAGDTDAMSDRRIGRSTDRRERPQRDDTDTEARPHADADHGRPQTTRQRKHAE